MQIDPPPLMRGTAPVTARRGVDFSDGIHDPILPVKGGA